MFVCKTLVWPAFLKFLYFVLYIEVLVNHDVKFYWNYFSHLFFLVNIRRTTLSPLAFFSRCTCLDMYWCSRSKYVKSEYTSMSLRAAIGDRWQVTGVAYSFPGLEFKDGSDCSVTDTKSRSSWGYRYFVKIVVYYIQNHVFLIYQWVLQFAASNHWV